MSVYKCGIINGDIVYKDRAIFDFAVINFGAICYKNCECLAFVVKF
ncbi:hypothetical protein BTHERMOSOX_715 [Bathymodiolus thermophilus thioautotrophic gill symbiont]|nr:hypothetical protein BTHERMOSOX_715 [Bathymodiolus thermophilus thioautotrophic gill symbiont]